MIANALVYTAHVILTFLTIYIYMEESSSLVLGDLLKVFKNKNGYLKI